MEEKQAVAEFVQYMQKLEQQKKTAKEELIQKLKGMGGSKTQEFIDWYYWETDNDLDVLSEILDVSINYISRYATAPYPIAYRCQHCKETRYHPCNSRADAKQFLKNVHGDRCKEDYYCDDCKVELQREYEEKLLKHAQAKEEKARDKAHLLRTMPYDEYLLTKHWKQFSKDRLIEANYQCTKCHRSDLKLNVHHLTYERRGYERPSDVKVLCEACHKETHGLPVPKHMIINPIPLRERVMQAIGK